ncbi:MAG: MnmC family methyltransferase [Rubrivivax sp.]
MSQVPVADRAGAGAGAASSVKTEPITAAAIEFDTEGVPHAPAFGDRYHARAGAMAQAEHVASSAATGCRGAGPAASFVVLETGFGLGVNFLATWAAWRREAAAGAAALRSRSTSTRRGAKTWHACMPRSPTRHCRGSTPQRWVGRLAAHRRPASPRLRARPRRTAARLRRRCGVAPVLQPQADAIFLDGFSARAQRGDVVRSRVRGPARACASGATRPPGASRRPVAEGLAANGFEVERAPGFAGKREMTVARFAPRHRPARTGAGDRRQCRRRARPSSSARGWLARGGGAR